MDDRERWFRRAPDRSAPALSSSRSKEPIPVPAPIRNRTTCRSEEITGEIHGGDHGGREPATRSACRSPVIAPVIFTLTRQRDRQTACNDHCTQRDARFTPPVPDEPPSGRRRGCSRPIARDEPGRRRPASLSGPPPCTAPSAGGRRRRCAPPGCRRPRAIHAAGRRTRPVTAPCRSAVSVASNLPAGRSCPDLDPLARTEARGGDGDQRGSGPGRRAEADRGAVPAGRPGEARQLPRADEGPARAGPRQHRAAPRRIRRGQSDDWRGRRRAPRSEAWSAVRRGRRHAGRPPPRPAGPGPRGRARPSGRRRRRARARRRRARQAPRGRTARRAPAVGQVCSASAPTAGPSAAGGGIGAVAPRATPASPGAGCRWAAGRAAAGRTRKASSTSASSTRSPSSSSQLLAMRWPLT